MDKDNRLGLEHKLMILDIHIPLYTSLSRQPVSLPCNTYHEGTYQYPSLANLYVHDLLDPAVVVDDDDVRRMGILVGRNPQIELGRKEDIEAREVFEVSVVLLLT
jgi:hypothetical protein